MKRGPDALDSERSTKRQRKELLEIQTTITDLKQREAYLVKELAAMDTLNARTDGMVATILPRLILNEIQSSLAVVRDHGHLCAIQMGTKKPVLAHHIFVSIGFHPSDMPMREETVNVDWVSFWATFDNDDEGMLVARTSTAAIPGDDLTIDEVLQQRREKVIDLRAESKEDENVRRRWHRSLYLNQLDVPRALAGLFLWAYAKTRRLSNDALLYALAANEA